MREMTFPEMIVIDWERERPDLKDSGIHVTFRLYALVMEIGYQFAEIASQEGVQLEDMLQLFALRRRGDPYCLRPTEVRSMLSLTSGAATYRIERLVKQGLCERKPDPSDRRSYVLRVVPKGMNVIDRTVEAVAVASSKVLTASGLTATQLATFLEYLTCIEAGWETIIPASENPLARRGGVTSGSKK
ncbi:MarR family transcriptional regulator [Haliea sp. E1-2-M8]|uniref:MarR family winged helix-turn-helix transcriptional regulator n=1 Tax=Haliea sp. E1-2-M8 TaxID=3064706 RepID=UPI002719160F|nr:MarR family transcriptional regulator [Haliea sp. E1-2-M8]MDO8864247.1 MarR family transcriptional regulator [Haliea sp. E1-2-M8]